MIFCWCCPRQRCLPVCVKLHLKILHLCSLVVLGHLLRLGLLYKRFQVPISFVHVLLALAVTLSSSITSPESADGVKFSLKFDNILIQ